MGGVELVFRLTRLAAGLAAAAFVVLTYVDVAFGWWLTAMGLAAIAGVGIWTVGNLWSRHYRLTTRLGGWDVARINHGRGFDVTGGKS